MVYGSSPSSPRHVSFMPIPVYSRQPRDDELYVIRRFEKHAGHCTHCADPVRSFRRGSSLCAKGHAYAADVAQYIYNREGRAYSLVDRKEHQRVRLELPGDLTSLRGLLSAFEAGMKLMEAPRRPRRQPQQPVSKRYSNSSFTSSDMEAEYAYSPADDFNFYQPETTSYVPAHPQPVFYQVVTPSSPTRPSVYYPR